jgi:glucosamine--fructose-6-phosphate aminotransferase (isomerizing)
MITEPTRQLSGGMVAEFREAPQAVRQQAQVLAAPIAALVDRLARRSPRFVVTCARGSSAHAATFAKHLFERHLGVPVAAAAPNISTVYRRQLSVKDQLFLTISQSGRSDDLVEATTMARAAGALTVAVVNDVESPLAATSEIVLPISAGREHSVAATKTFVASLAALLRLTAVWAGNEEMRRACDRLPDRIANACELDWRTALKLLGKENSLVAIGRGPTLAIAREAALKLKETCAIHAEAFSAAEFCHGPMALVAPNFPIFLFKPGDEAAVGLSELIFDLRSKRALVLIAETGGESPAGLPSLPADHPDADAICLIQSFYGLLVHLAQLRGTDIDKPRHLKKVTRTR